MDADLIKLRDELTPSVNKPFKNELNEYVYLKPLFLNGKRIGLTDCCSYDTPCKHHSRFKQTENNSLN